MRKEEKKNAIEHITEAVIDRPNRFIAHEINGQVETVHVIQAGAESLIPKWQSSGKSSKSSEKTAYDLIMQQKAQGSDQYGLSDSLHEHSEWVKAVISLFRKVQ